MLFPLRPDYRVITTAGVGNASYSLQLSREFWLESIILKVTCNWSTLTTPSANSWLNTIKRVRMSVTDATGNRKVVDCSGCSLVNFHRQVVGSVDRATAVVMPGTGGVSTGTNTMYFPIWFRHPQLADPFGAATMLPLPRLSTDPVLEIETGGTGATADDVAATATLTGNITIEALINRRDVLTPNFPYVPGELISYVKSYSSAGKADWEIPSLGTVTGILHEDYTSATAKGTALSATTDDWSLEYLSTVIRRYKADHLQAVNDFTVDLNPATWNNPAGTYYHDFITDLPGQDAFNLGSALDLNPLALNGGKARIIGSSCASGARSVFTVHKLFGDLRGLKFV